jgi:L-alanine-DL-glutamate epimerase-like enolase superfamily enzyme
MKITKVEAIGLSYPLEKPIWDSQHHIASRNCVLVKVYTDEGFIGVGEAAHFGGPLISTITILEKELAPLVIGEDPHAVERIWDKVYRTTIQHGRRGIVIAALSGIDIALWDIIGQKAGLPLYRLLGYSEDRVQAYASTGFYSEGKGPEELAQEAGAAVQAGFRAVKIKVGGLPLREDLKRVEAVRATVGKDVRLMVDANSNWEVPTALKAARALEELDIAWIEEPVAVDDIEGSARVALATSIPIAGYEQETTRYGFKELILRKAVHIVQPDAIWSGGITECRKIAALAAAWNLRCIPHVFSSAICLAANLHLLASIPNGGWVEFDQNPNALREELILQPFRIDKDGCVALPERPGLGIVLNSDIIERYRIHV